MFFRFETAVPQKRLGGPKSRPNFTLFTSCKNLGR